MKDRDAKYAVEDLTFLGQEDLWKLPMIERYKREVRQYRRLTDAENNVLARRIQAGEARNAPLHAQNVAIRKRNKTIIQANHTIAMFTTCKDRPFLRGAANVRRDPYPLIPDVDPYQFTDHDAIDTMVRGNLDYALRLAFRFRRSWIPMMDLVSAANDGLLEAVRKFNPERERCAFAPYAWWEIRGAIGSYVSRHGELVVRPPEVRQWHKRVRMTRTKLEKSLHRKPTTVELAEAMGLEADRLYTILAERGATHELDAPVAKDGTDTNYNKLLVAPDETEPLDPAWSRRVESSLAAIHTLPTRQAKVVAMFYGLDPQSPPHGMSFWEICLELDISEARVERMFEMAMEQLREEQAPTLRPVFEEWMEAVA